MPADTPRSTYRRKYRFPCPYKNCGRWFKSQQGATRHQRGMHAPSELLVLDPILELDQSIPVLPDQGLDQSSDTVFSDLANSDPFSDANLDEPSNPAMDENGNNQGGEDSDMGGPDPPHPDLFYDAELDRLEDDDLAAYEDYDQDEVGSDLHPDLGGNNPSSPWTEDPDSNDSGSDEPESQKHPGTYHQYQEYHPYLNGGY